ncbi:MAG TPA: YfjI family protein [Methylocella sp.]|jgi:putative DNA primase/helicase
MTAFRKERPAIDEWQDIAALRKAAVGLAEAYEPSPTEVGQEWPEPKPLPDGLLPVAAFDPAFLPEAIAPWVMDISDRMQCPPDFVAIPAMVALGSAIGHKVAVRPQRKTDWYEVANLWGCIVGRPGAMKSPAMDEALKPLYRLDAEARKANEAAAKDYEARVEFRKLQKEDAQKKTRNGLTNGTASAAALIIEEPDEPKALRYVVNDATYEALGVILADNPDGTLAFRDELVSLLKTLDREEHVAARGFFLTAWNGKSGYTFDRIIRGRTHIEAACLSLLGSTQPGRLAEYLRRAISGGAGDDGMVQRFSLLGWPDQNPHWANTDRYPASEPREAAWRVFQRLDELTPDSIGAAADEFGAVPYLRFDAGAQAVFNEWREKLEKRLRSDDLTPALESHLAKYRKLVPSLALINHLADGGAKAITGTAMLRALAFAEYLETRAKRAYGAGAEAETSAAKAILKHIRKGDLSDGFTGRDVHRPRWSNLSDRDHVQAGLDLLCDLDWLFAEKRETGGRPTFVYRINPRGSQ